MQEVVAPLRVPSQNLRNPTVVGPTACFHPAHSQLRLVVRVATCHTDRSNYGTVIAMVVLGLASIRFNYIGLQLLVLHNNFLGGNLCELWLTAFAIVARFITERPEWNLSEVFGELQHVASSGSERHAKWALIQASLNISLYSES